MYHLATTHSEKANHQLSASVK